MMLLNSSLSSSILLGVIALAGLTYSHVIPRNVSITTEPPGGNELQLREDDGIDDPTVFTWVSRFAAIGDSYTAGIGSGSRLGSLFHFNDWWCSRYDLSYPMIIRNYLGSNVEDFQFLACTGDQTKQVYDQVKKLDDNIDLLTLTAGGNDLCLIDVIKDCIMFPFHGEETCNAILDKAQSNLDDMMHDNIKQILTTLNDKMADNGIVVYNSYARFFNTENDDCAKKRDWTFLSFVRYLQEDLKPPLELTIERRKRFNSLTSGLNDLIRDVVDEVKDEADYTVGFANWDLWGIDGVDGQMCDPSSTGAYPDPKQPDLLFFKPDTRNTIFKLWPFSKRNIDAAVDPETLDAGEEDSKPLDDGDGDGDGDLELDEEQIKTLRAALPPPPPKPDLDERGVDRSIYKSSLWNSVNPDAEVVKKLDPRAPDTPGCPSDKRPWVPSLGGLLPDFFGRIFHPNVEGHTAMASFTVEMIMTLRAKILDVEPEVCEVTEEFKCWQKEGWTAYVTPDQLNKNYKKFCDWVEAPGDGSTGWRRTWTFFKDTPDEQEFVFETGEHASEFDKDECLESMDRIINGCDGNDPKNPLGFKFGGLWKRGEYTYKVNPKRDNRPWPLKETYGWCKGGYHVTYSDYTMYGE